MRKISVRRWLFFLSLITFTIFLLTYPIWLTSLASFLIINDTPVPSDAIVVLSLDSKRLDYAARLYQNKTAPFVIASCGQKDFDTFNIFIKAEVAIKNYLVHQDVSEDHLILFTDVTSTYDEAVRVREIVEKKGFTSLIVVSSPFHLRRSQYVFQKVLKGSSVTMRFSGPPLETFDMKLEKWWTRENELLWVFSEYVKLMMYWLKY